MTMGALDLKTVRLVADLLWMKERKDMTLFTISHWTLEEKNASNSDEGLKMRIVLKRKLMNELMTTYVPSVLLILITWATTFFKPFFFEAALSVNLTTMLVMTTIFIGVMQSLPSTAYIKMIDVWLLFGQLIPFTEVIILTAKEYAREGNGSGEMNNTIQVITQPKALQPVQVNLQEGEGMRTVSDVTTEHPHDASVSAIDAWNDKKDPTKVYRAIGEGTFLEQ